MGLSSSSKGTITMKRLSRLIQAETYTSSWPEIVSSSKVMYQFSDGSKFWLTSKNALNIQWNNSVTLLDTQNNSCEFVRKGSDWCYTNGSNNEFILSLDHLQDGYARFDLEDE